MKPLPAELEAKINEINSWILFGDLKTVAKKARKSTVYTSNVLNKKAFNKQVIEAAIEVMNANKEKFEIPVMKVA